MATCFHHHDRETGRVHPLRASRVPRLPDPGLGRVAVLRVRQAGVPKKTVRIRQTLQRDPLIATKLITAITIGGYLLISLRDSRSRGPDGPRSIWRSSAPP